jgi:hypothetical protein
MFFAIAASISVVITGLGLMATTPTRGKSKPASSLPFKATKKSPKKKPITAIRIDEDSFSQKRKMAYNLKIIKLRPDFELMWIDATPGNDGYGQKLFDLISREEGFRDNGILMVAKRRVSLENTAVLTNVKDTYPRRCIVRFLGDDESTPTSRLAMLRALQSFLVQPAHNVYNYDYLVNEASDLTPVAEDQLEAMDHYIHDSIIVNLMCCVFVDTGIGWYAENTECALDFFSGPTFPTYAIDQLGYPAGGIDGKGIAAHLNLPENDK